MEGQGTLRLITIIAATITLAFAATANADNYGGVNHTTKQRVINMIYAKFGKGWQGQKAVRVAACESGFNPRAANWRDANGGSHGLFQINGAHRGWVNFNRIYNPAYNINVAYRLSRGGNSWSAWSCA